MAILTDRTFKVGTIQHSLICGAKITHDFVPEYPVFANQVLKYNCESSTSCPDLSVSGASNLGALTDITSITGVVGKAYSLNGATSKIIITENSSVSWGAGAFTWAFWINTSDTEYCFLVDDDGNTGVYTQDWVGNEFYLSVRKQAVGSQSSESSVAVNDGTWKLVIVGRDSTEQFISVNGTNTDTDAGNVFNVDIARDLSIGFDTRKLNGYLDEIMFFKRKLSLNERKALYNMGF